MKRDVKLLFLLIRAKYFIFSFFASVDYVHKIIRNGMSLVFIRLHEKNLLFSVPPSGHLPRTLPQPHSDRAGRSLGRNPTIKISRATRVSEQWNASLDREIKNANELRHLDEFLGNQVSQKEQDADFFLEIL